MRKPVSIRPQTPSNWPQILRGHHADQRWVLHPITVMTRKTYNSYDSEGKRPGRQRP